MLAFVVSELRRKRGLSWGASTRQTFKNVFVSDRQYRFSHWFGAIATAANTIMFAWGFILSEALNVSILNSGALLLITLWKRFVRKVKMSRRDTLIAFLGCLGLVVVVIARFNPDQRMGTALGIGCAVTMMISQLCTDRSADPDSRGTEGLECWTLGGILVVILCGPSLWWSGLPSLWDAGLIVLLAVIHGAGGDILYLSARSGPRAVPVVKAVLVCRLNPVLSGFWTWYYLDEVPAGLAVFGAGIILSAIAAQALGKPAKPIQPSEFG
jgi:drug/metabolite transporter (DMT)-like permease